MEDNENLVTISNRTLCSFVKVQNISRIVCAVLCSVSDCLSYQQKYMTVQKFQMREIGKNQKMQKLFRRFGSIGGKATEFFLHFLFIDAQMEVVQKVK